MPRPKTKAAPTRYVRGANDNAPAGEACVTDLGAPLPALTGDQRQALRPLVRALARLMAADQDLVDSSETN